MSAVQAWRWRLVERGPPLTRALHVGAAARAAALEQLRKRGINRFPYGFYRSQDHSHAFWLPDDDDEDGFIDHVLVFAESGITASVIAAMADVQRLDVGGCMYAVEPEWMGARGGGGLFGPAAIWTTVTPYVTANYRESTPGKKRDDYEPPAQLHNEIISRRNGAEGRLLPAPIARDWRPIEWIGEDMIVANAFEFVRGGGGRGEKSHAPPGDAVAAFATLAFPEPVWGPLAFGYGAHFGLGLLRPRG